MLGHQKSKTLYIFFIIIDRSGYMSTVTYCFLYMFFDAAQVGYEYVSLVIIPRI